MDEPLTILVAARDEEAVIARTVSALRRALPEAEVIVADDGSRDRTADVAEAAGALVLRLPRRGKGRQGRDWKLLEHDPAGSGSFKKWSHPFIK